jgi:glycosyltransferase involved in cell wall biosynthesis
LDALAQCPDAQALIVGAPLFPEDDVYQAQIYRQCRDLGLDARVRFVGDRPDVPDLMKLCDVVVHASTAPEPFGRVIVEAMLAGRPVVASAAGGVLEIVEAEKTGLLVRPGDPAALAAALTRLDREEGLAARLAAAAEKVAIDRFTLRSMLGVLETHIRDTAAAARR